MKQFALASIITITGIFGLHTTSNAATGTMAPVVKQLTADGTNQLEFNAYAQNLKSGVRVAIGDTDGDGQDNIITAAGQGGGPEIRVFSLNGTLLSRFFAYAPTFRGGVNVSAYDLDNDGRAEIITGPGIGGGPEVKVFHQDGSLIRKFFAFDSKFRGGTNIVASSFGRNGEAMIAVGSGYGSGHVRLFSAQGNFSGISFFPFGTSVTHGVVVGALQESGNRTKIVVAPERSSESTVKVFSLNDTSKAEKSFLAFAKTFKGGVHLANADVDSDGIEELIIGAGVGGGPHVKVFNEHGQLKRSFFAYASSFRGGTYVSASGSKIITGPGAIALEGRTDLRKYIEVDLSDQTLKFFQDGRLLGSRKVSTGKWSTPTPIGTHVIKNKIPLAYSKPYDLYMEWWMAFTPDGSYGLHALPFWKLANGGRKYEGVGHIGTPVSHGCIRQSILEAKSLYEWADIGTVVIVKR